MKEKEFLNKLGQRIRDLRTEKSWTLCDLAAIINMDTSDLSKLELGYTNSKILTLYKISQAFGITVSELTNIE
jgi:transcriptional regulator with XRE-family HTH domain